MDLARVASQNIPDKGLIRKGFRNKELRALFGSGGRPTSCKVLKPLLLRADSQYIRNWRQAVASVGWPRSCFQRAGWARSSTSCALASGEEIASAKSSFFRGWGGGIDG